MNNTVVVTEDRLELRGAEVDAINYPDWNRIELNRRRWAEYDLQKKTALMLHEYLGIVRADDSHYQISGAFSDLAIQPAPPKFEFQAHWGLEKLFTFHGFRLYNIGGEVGYKLNPVWTVGVGFDSFHRSGDWGFITRNIYGLFGKYNFNAWGKFQPYAKLGLFYASNRYMASVGGGPWGRNSYNDFSHGDSLGYSAGVGGTYWLSSHFGLDLGLNLIHGELDTGLMPNYPYSSTIGLRAQF